MQPVRRHTVYLFRHGEPIWEYSADGKRLKAGPRAGLSPQGQRNISANAHELKRQGVRLDYLFSSTLQRAIESAQIYRDVLGVPLADGRDSRLNDIELPESWEGLPSGDIRTRRREHRQYDQKVESDIQDFWDEFGRFLLTVDHDVNVGIVSHATPIVDLLFRLQHPDQPVPHLDELEGNPKYWIERSQAWKLTVEDGRVVNTEKLDFGREVFDEMATEMNLRGKER